MAQPKKDWSKQRTLFTIKKGQNSTMLRPGKGVKIFVDGQEVEFVETEYNGKKGQTLYINKVDDEIARIEEMRDTEKMTADKAKEQLEYLNKQKEYGVSSFVKGFIK
jgi:hypothetical protein